MQVGELQEAVTYGRTKLANFFGLPGYEDLVQVLSIIQLLSSITITKIQ